MSCAAGVPIVAQFFNFYKNWSKAGGRVSPVLSLAFLDLEQVISRKLSRV